MVNFLAFKQVFDRKFHDGYGNGKFGLDGKFVYFLGQILKYGVKKFQNT